MACTCRLTLSRLVSANVAISKINGFDVLDVITAKRTKPMLSFSAEVPCSPKLCPVGSTV